VPLQLLSIAYSGDAQVQTLKGAEWQGGQTMPVGDALLPGYYLNELLMKLMARDDPHEQLFDGYAQMVSWLRDAGQLDSSLRAFELLLLREIGLLPALDCSSVSGTALESDVLYSLVPELGLREASDLSEQAAMPAAAWQSLQAALDERAAIVPARLAVQAMTAGDRQALKQQLRSLLNYQVGGKGLRTRQLMRDAQSLSF
jgi:DNA repair protein RecO (recombination protein O)